MCISLSYGCKTKFIKTQVLFTVHDMCHFRFVWNSQFQDMTDTLPCHVHLPVCMCIMDPHSRATRKNWAMEMRCYCKILCISNKDHAANEEVYAVIQQAIKPHEDLLTIVKRCKLEWYGLVSCSSALVKVILQGTVKGGRRQGRQKKEVGRHHLGFWQAWSSPIPRGQ